MNLYDQDKPESTAFPMVWCWRCQRYSADPAEHDERECTRAQRD